MIFTYMGPTEKQPVLPRYEWTSLAPETICPVKSYLECNYLQGIEGDFDSSHTSFLHNNNIRDMERLKRDGAPTLGSRSYRLRHEGGFYPKGGRRTDLCPHQSLHHAFVQHRARSAHRKIRRR